jgi:hypothetical protein
METANDLFYDDLQFTDFPRHYVLTIKKEDQLDPCFFPRWSERRFRDFLSSYIKTSAAQGETATPITLTLFIANDLDYDQEGQRSVKQTVFKIKAQYLVAHFQEQTEQVHD